MPSYIPYLLALGALSTSVAADNIYTYTQGGCTGPAFMFKDIDHNICAVTITSNATNIADAIDRGITTVHSAKLEVQETGKKHFIGWDEGPESNTDGLLQCGTIIKNVPVKKRETCIEGGLHGVSWTEPGDNKKRQAGDVYSCTGTIEPNAVFCEGKHYDMDKASAEDKERLKELARKGGAVQPDLEKYLFTPAM